MSHPNIEASWLNAFVQVFEKCTIAKKESVVVLAEQQSRADLITLTELALAQLDRSYYRIVLPPTAPQSGPLVRSSGASLALSGQASAVAALCNADVIIDLTVEGLMHAAETATILQSGARIMNISNEHPEALSRLLPDESVKDQVKSAVRQLKAASQMKVESAAGTNLSVNLTF